MLYVFIWKIPIKIENACVKKAETASVNVPFCTIFFRLEDSISYFFSPFDWSIPSVVQDMYSTPLYLKGKTQGAGVFLQKTARVSSLVSPPNSIRPAKERRIKSHFYDIFTKRSSINDVTVLGRGSGWWFCDDSLALQSVTMGEGATYCVKSFMDVPIC